MAAADNLQPQQFGPDVYKANRSMVLYQRSLAKTPVRAIESPSTP
jgi:hypothetical protein